MTSIAKIARFSLTTAGAGRLAAFYQRAFGFRQIALEQRSAAEFARLPGVAGGVRALTLGLGEQIVELVEFTVPGQPYPADAASSDIAFQHFAIVVADMRAAYARLRDVAGWAAITSDGPQKLPESSGGVTAFKFRDPEGHPLELLAFPKEGTPPEWRVAGAFGPCLGIDHSAISVTDTTRSVAFYEALGFAVSARSRNHGPEQGRLDRLPTPEVEVTALTPLEPTPHVELLCYRSSAPGVRPPLRDNDVAATRLVLQAPAPAGASPRRTVRRSLFDPDGHHLVIDEAAET